MKKITVRMQEISSTTDAQAKSILNTLSKQDFSDFYEEEFNDFIEGSEDAMTEKEILKEIKSLFHL